MKNKKIILYTLLGVLLLNTSCKKWLEEESFTSILTENIYKDEGGLNVGLGALYNLQRAYECPSYISGLQQNNLWLYCADDLGCTRTFNDAQIYKSNMTAINFPNGKWSAGYQLIDRASGIINGANAVSFSSAAAKNKMVAEAKVIRAMTYFTLWQLYDRILIDTIPTTVDNFQDPVEYKPAATADVLNLINSDLDFGIANLSYNVLPGQINKGLARHIRAKVAAWQNDWTTAADQCDKIITEGGYALQPVETVFAEAVSNKETIYAYQYDEILGTGSAAPGGEHHYLPAFFNARYYEMPGGHMIEDNVWGGNSFAWTTPNFYLKRLLGWDAVTGLSPDKRFTAYFYPDTIIANNPRSIYFGQKLPANAYPGANKLGNYRQYHWSVKKFQDLLKPAGRAGSTKDVIAVRLAETLLMGAEAHWRMTNNPANPTALLYINRVRTRAGMPALVTIDQQTILDESARELAFEGQRWFLLKRMGVLKTQVDLYHTFGSASSNEAPFPMQAHMVRWPIPQGQIDLMGPSFPQNPGY